MRTALVATLLVGSAFAAEGTFTLEHSPLTSGKPGQDIDFEAKLPAEGAYDVVVYWRVAGGEWRTLRMEGAGGAYKAQLAGALVTGDVEYYLEAFDANLASVKKGSKEAPFKIGTGAAVPAAAAGIIGPETPAAEKPAEAEAHGAREEKQEGTGAEREQQAGAHFIKGEITNLGGTKLVNKNNRIGLRIGYSKEGGASLESGGFLAFARTGIHMLAITPEVDLKLFEKLGVGLGLPLRIPAYDPERTLGGAQVFPRGFFAVNPSDFDELSEIARLIRYVTWGRKEDHLYVNVSQLFATTIGHGTIMRRYFANANLQSARVGAEVDWYGDYGGFEAFTGDILQPHKLVGAIGFLKPFGFSDSFMMKSLSLGATYIADFAAPIKWTPALSDPTKMALESTTSADGRVYSNGLPKIAPTDTAAAQVAGVDLEMRVLELKDAEGEWGNVKPYLDFSTLALSGGGHGATLGALGRFNFLDRKNPLILRFRAELRYFMGNYLPGYFDSFYEIQKYSFITGSDEFGGTIPKPKLSTVLARAPGWTPGAYLEAQVGWKNGLALTAAFETNGVDAGSNYVLHLEVPIGTWAQIFATYHRRSFTLFPAAGQPQQFFDISGKSPNTLIYIGARMAILPLIYINGRLYQTWIMERDETDPAVGLGYKNSLNFEVDLEIAWEWGT